MISPFDLEPVHTRHVIIESAAGAGAGRRIRGRLVDLRHRGTTWVGELATRPGLVHDMSAEIAVDDLGRITHAAGAMQRPAFEADASTSFESCRDMLGNVGGLAGSVVGEDIQQTIAATIGGARGCYHLTTLVRAMAPVATRPHVRERRVRIEGWRHGTHDLVVDARLDDLGSSDDALAHSRLRFAIGVDDPRPHDLQVEHRYADADGQERSCSRSAATSEMLSRVPLLPGFARSLGEQAAAGGGCGSLVELAFAISAVASQILLHLAWPAVAGTGGRAANTCWMWRAGGPLLGRPIAKDDQ